MTGTGAGEAPRLDWKGMDKAILDAIQQLEAHGFTEPTIRSVYYVLGSLNIIPLTKNGYKSLDRKMVEMRLSGAIPWGFFAVKRGTQIEAGVKVNLPHNFRANVPYVPPKDWAEHFLTQLKNASENFQLPRWYKQKNLVEVWVEKDGLLGATANWISDLEVTVRAPQGYGAWEFIHDAVKKIKRELKEQGKESVRILYLGDLDPSGKDIPRFMSQEAISHFENTLGIKDLSFTEIALTPEQVREFKLPQTPESDDVMAKIGRDPRMRWYQAHYPADMFTELDAFYALATDSAMAMIRESIIALFDDDIHEATRADEKKMKKIVTKEVSDGVEDWLQEGI